MRKQRLSLLLIMLFLAIGFAAVTTNLIINGTSKIGVGDFDVYFTNVGNFYLSGGEMNGTYSLSSDRKTISFNTNQLVDEDDHFYIAYEVQNASNDYDANVTFNINYLSGEEIQDHIETVVVKYDDYRDLYTGGSSIVMVQNEDTFFIPAGEKIKFIFGIQLKQAVLEDHTIEMSLTYDAEPVERTSHIDGLGIDEVESYLSLEPGLYTLDKQQIKTWQELLDEKILTIREEDGYLTTNLENSEELNLTGWYDNPRGFRKYMTEANNSCANLQGMLVIDTSIDYFDPGSLVCSGLKAIVYNKPIDMATAGESFTEATVTDQILFTSSQALYQEFSYAISYGMYTAINPVITGDFAVDPYNSSKLLGYLGEEENYTLPDNFTMIYGAPFFLSNVKNLVIPDTVTYIAPGALKGVTNVTYNGPATYDDDDQYWGAKRLNAVVSGDFLLDANDNSRIIGYIGESPNIIIPEGIKEIGDNCFANINVESITFPSTLLKIGKKAFYNTRLNELEIPNTITEIGKEAFKSITYLTYHGPATYEEDDEYWGAKYLNALIIDGFVLTGDNNEILTDYLGTSKDIVIPDGVITIGDNVFKNKTLNSVTFNNSVTTIGEYAFAYTGLSIIDVPNTVTEIGRSAFRNIMIVNYTGSATYASSDEYWGASYMNCSINDVFILSEDQKTIQKYIGSSYSVIIPDGITTIGDNAFSSKYITSVTIPSSVTTIGEYAFANCHSSLTVTVPDTVTSIGYHAFYRDYSVNYSGTATYGEDDEYWGAKMINGGYVANGLRYTDNTLTKIVDDSGYTEGRNIVIPNTVVEIGEEAFEFTTAASITIPDSVKTIGEEAFHWCKLNSVLVIPSTVETIEESAFDGVRALEYHGTLNDNNNWGATAFNAYIEDNHAYSDSTKTTLLSYFGTEKNYTIPETVTTIGPEAFFYNVFEEFNLTENITTIGGYAFQNSTMNKLTIPRSITRITNSMLKFCNANEIILPDTLIRIDDGAFTYTKTTSITIPASVNYLGTGLFNTSSHVNSVTFENTTGWTVTKGSETINVDSSQLADPTSAFNLLNTTYKDYTWSRS